GIAMARATDCLVTCRDIIYFNRYMLDMLASGQDNPAGNGRTDHFMTRYTYRVDAIGERERLRVVDEGQDHATQCRIGMQVIVPPGDSYFFQASLNGGNIVCRPCHRRPYVGKYNRVTLSIQSNSIDQVIIIHLAIRQ